MTPEARALLDRMRSQVESESGLDLERDPEALAKLRAAADQAALDIRRFGRTVVTLPALFMTGEGPYHFTMALDATDVGGSAR